MSESVEDMLAAFDIVILFCLSNLTLANYNLLSEPVGTGNYQTPHCIKLADNNSIPATRLVTELVFWERISEV